MNINFLKMTGIGYVLCLALILSACNSPQNEALESGELSPALSTNPNSLPSCDQSTLSNRPIVTLPNIGFEDGTMNPWYKAIPKDPSDPNYVQNEISLVQNAPGSGSNYSVKIEVQGLEACNYPSFCYPDPLAANLDECADVTNPCRHRELAVKAKYVRSRVGMTVRYHWSMMFEKLPVDATQGFIFSQFHTSPADGGSPAISLAIQDKIIRLKTKTWKLDANGERIPKGFTKDSNGQNVCVKSWKANAAKALGKSDPIELGVWYDFEMEVKWVMWDQVNPDGYIKFGYKKQTDSDFTPLKNLQGQVQEKFEDISTLNSQVQYFQWGAYWGKKGLGETVLYLDDFNYTVLSN